MKVGVIGSGYVGLVTAVGLASKGQQVTAIEIDKKRLNQISQGEVPFHEPGVGKLLKSCLHKKTIRFSSQIEDVAPCDVVLICVQTPPQKGGAIDLNFLKSAAGNLAEVFKKNPKNRTVVVRSTVVPGTTHKIVTPIFNNLAEVTVNPEFLREGLALEDFINPDRIVIGTPAAKTNRLLKNLYESFNAPIIWTTPSTAELVKYTSNTLLATLISFSNEIARLCEKTPGSDIEEVLGIIHKDRRFSQIASSSKFNPSILSYLKAGCGFGGSCLPKDLSALIDYGRTVGEDTPLLKSVAQVNITQPLRVVNQAKDILRDIKNRTIAILGVSFKGGTDDIRESPGLKMVNELLSQHARVIIYDPLVKPTALKDYQDRGVVIALTLKAAIKNADICIITTNAPEFTTLGRLKKNSGFDNIKIIDGRRILKVSKNSSNNYYPVGRFR